MTAIPALPVGLAEATDVALAGGATSKAVC